MRKYFYADDDAFDERGCLRDGKSVRIPLTMLDAKPAPDIRQQFADGELEICDVHGNTKNLLRGSRFLRRRDGSDAYRFAVKDAERDAGAAAAARKQMIEDSCNAWRGGKEAHSSEPMSANDAYAEMVKDSENAWRRRRA